MLSQGGRAALDWGQAGQNPLSRGPRWGLDFFLNSKREVSVVSLISRCALRLLCRRELEGWGRGWGPGS